VQSQLVGPGGTCSPGHSTGLLVGARFEESPFEGAEQPSPRLGRLARRAGAMGWLASMRGRADGDVVTTLTS